MSTFLSATSLGRKSKLSVFATITVSVLPPPDIFDMVCRTSPADSIRVLRASIILMPGTLEFSADISKFPFSGSEMMEAGFVERVLKDLLEHTGAGSDDRSLVAEGRSLDGKVSLAMRNGFTL